MITYYYKPLIITIITYYLGSNYRFSTRGTAYTWFVYIKCYDNRKNLDSNACQNIVYLKPSKIEIGLVMW